MGLFTRKRALSDLPPPPPPVHEVSLPSIDDMDAQLPPMPPLPELRQPDFSELPPPPSPEHMSLPEVPHADSFDHASFLEEHAEQPEPRMVMPTSFGERDLALEAEEPKIVQQGSVFVPVRSYTSINEDIAAIKTHLKGAEDGLTKLSTLKESRDSLFEKFRVQLEDVQRKSAYIERSLFKGGVL